MASTRAPQASEVWMYLTEQGRKRLGTLMVIQEKSQRDVARAAGWASHSYLGRLLRGDVSTLDPEPALRIARYLGVGVDDLFLVKISNPTGDNIQPDKVPA